MPQDTNLERQQYEPDDAANEAYKNDEGHAQGSHKASEQKKSVPCQTRRSAKANIHSLPAEFAAAAHLSKSNVE